MYRIEPGTDLAVPSTVSGIEVRIHEQSLSPEGDPGPGRDVWIEDDGSTIVYTSGRNAAFEIRNGEEILMDPTTIESKAEIGLNLLGPLLRLVLLQRGEFLLHASVVRVGTRTVLFIAPSGHGKSTLAAGLYDRGHAVLSDDTGIVRTESGPTVLAGPPVIKLDEASAGRIARTTEPVFPDGLEAGKRFYRLADDDVPDRSSIDAVYLVERGEAVELEPAPARDATVEFVRNAWGLPDGDDGALAENLQRSADLAEAVAVRRIRYPRSFEVFDEVLDRIEGECNCGG